MVHKHLEQEILEQIKELGPEEQRQILDFVRALNISKPKGVPGKALLRFAGSIAAEDLQYMAKAIDDGCEKVNPNEW